MLVQELCLYRINANYKYSDITIKIGNNYLGEKFGEKFFEGRVIFNGSV
jgi:hypothetical protein